MTSWSLTSAGLVNRLLNAGAAKDAVEAVGYDLTKREVVLIENYTGQLPKSEFLDLRQEGLTAVDQVLL